MSENQCPWCGSKAVNVTTHDDLAGFDQRQKFICTGAVCHEWRDGDGLDPEPSAPKKSLLDKVFSFLKSK